MRKIAIDAGFSCPNRDGSLSDKGCIYCNNSSFNPHFAIGLRTETKETEAFLTQKSQRMVIPFARFLRKKMSRIFGRIQNPIAKSGFSQNTNKKLSVKEQIEKVIKNNKNNAKFVAYFQAFTNTYAPAEKLKELYSQIYGYPEIIGLSIGTRPDCVNEEKLALIDSFTQKYDTWIEYGLQSANDETLKAINRGHNFNSFVEAFKLTRKYKRIKTCVHIIIGLPGEKETDVLNTAKHLADLCPDGIKIHPLHIVKNTILEKMFMEGMFRPTTLEEYASAVINFIELQSPTTVIHRITADCPRELLIAPEWILEKQKLLDTVNELFKKRETFQGKLYKTTKF